MESETVDLDRIQDALDRHGDHEAHDNFLRLRALLEAEEESGAEEITDHDFVRPYPPNSWCKVCGHAESLHGTEPEEGSWVAPCSAYQGPGMLYCRNCGHSKRAHKPAPGDPAEPEPEEGEPDLPDSEEVFGPFSGSEKPGVYRAFDKLRERIEALEEDVRQIRAHVLHDVPIQPGTPEPDSETEPEDDVESFLRWFIKGGSDYSEWKARVRAKKLLARLRYRPSEEAADRVVRAARDLCGDLSPRAVTRSTPSGSWVYKKEELKAALRALESLRMREEEDDAR